MTDVGAHSRTDWYVWSNPDTPWCGEHAEVPGLQWDGDGEHVTSVKFHRSHEPVMPPEVINALPVRGTWAQHRAADIEQHLFVNRGITLREHQREALPFLLSRENALLAYEMRLGKSLCASAVHDPNEGPIVVLGPLAARDVWREWIEKVHGFEVTILAGRTNLDIESARGKPAYFVHFDVADAWSELLTTMEIATLVIDEIHLLQNRKSKRASAANAITNRATRIIGLSGTPMWNKPDSVYSLLHLIAPGAWGAHFSYGKRYCAAMSGAHGWSFDGVSNEQEFTARLKRVMLRKTWKEAAPHLPPTTRVVEPVSVSGAQQAALETAAINATLAKSTNTTVAGYLATLRRKMADVKVKPAIEAVYDAWANGHPKVVVWTWHKEVAKKIEGQVLVGALARMPDGASVFHLRAEDSADERARQVKGFHNCDGNAVMVSGMLVGGVAIDLSCADYAIFAELDWIPANVQQAEMRTFSPDRPHVIVYLYADVPTETKLLEVLQIKEGFATSLDLGFDEVARRILG